MTNLIFDVNNIVHRSLFVVGGFGSKAFTFDSQSEIDQLMRKIATDVSFIVRLINPSRIILAQDDSSWRKDIVIDENEGYKANRVKTKMINWNNVYNAIDEFTEIMENNGMIISKIPKAEADDIITMWAKEIQINQKQHVIIVSGDEDLRQLVGSYNKNFITVFNPFMQGKNASRKLYVSNNFESWINKADEVDFMNMKGTINVDKEDFKKIITSERTKMEVINGRMIGLRKVFCGDDSDNVPAIYTWINEKGKEVRITNSKFEKIYEIVAGNERLDYMDLLEKSDKVMEAIKTVTKQNPPFDIDKILERQMKLVILDAAFFPEEIVDEFVKNKNKQLEKPKVNYSSLNMHDLLEGTQYVRERKYENEAGIFKEIDRITGKSLF